MRIFETALAHLKITRFAGFLSFFLASGVWVPNVTLYAQIVGRAAPAGRIMALSANPLGITIGGAGLPGSAPAALFVSLSPSLPAGGLAAAYRLVQEDAAALSGLPAEHPAFSPLFYKALTQESDAAELRAAASSDKPRRRVEALIARDAAKFAGNPSADEILSSEAVATCGGCPFRRLAARAGKLLPTRQASEAVPAVIDDQSRLNKTLVRGVVRPKTEADILQALALAREKGLKVSMAGARHSMGGQSFFPNGLVLDMMDFNRMSLDEENKVLTVQAGATWAQAQKFLDPRGLSMDVMQAVNGLSVGGTLSVNAHGSNAHSGPIASTVRSIRIMRADGSIVAASREENQELFRLALGGYGLFGVILDARIAVRANAAYRLDIHKLNDTQYLDFFDKNLAEASRYEYAHSFLSVDPRSLLKEMTILAYAKDPTPPSRLPALEEERRNPLVERGIAFFFRLGNTTAWGKKLMWAFLKEAPKHGPRLFTRNQAMNQSASVFTGTGPKRTLILQEYFLPRRSLVAFLDKAREIIARRGVDVIIANVRPLKKDDTSFLAYAKGEDRWAIVFNFIQSLTAKANAEAAEFTREVIDEALKLGGTFYLPYRLVYSPEQLRAAYPEADEFFRLKRKYDPSELFVNHFYDRYGRQDAPQAPEVGTAVESPVRAGETGREPPRAAGWFLSQMRQLLRDVLGYMTRAANAPEAKAAGMVRLHPLPFKDLYLVTDPALVRQVLTAGPAKFIRSHRAELTLKRFFGRSLLTTEGEEHQRIRQEVKAAFKPNAVREYVSEVAGMTERRLTGWKPGQTLDVSTEMHELALQAFARSFFGIDDGAAGDRVLQAMRGLGRVLAESFRSLPIPSWIPTRLNREQARVNREVDEALYALIEERIARPSAQPTLLDELIAAEPMTPERKRLIRDQLTALFFAGHETSANLLSWTFQLIAEHSDVEQKVRDELAAVLGDRPISPADLDRLPYLKTVILEVMRLYPPGWVLDYEPVEDVNLGGYRIPRGKEIFIPIFLLHRNPAFFDHPEEFLPERFAGDRLQGRKSKEDAYIPFGGGLHYCLGHAFAMDSVQAIVATILRRLRLSPVAQARPVPAPGASLGIKGGLKMVVEIAPRPESAVR